MELLRYRVSLAGNRDVSGLESRADPPSSVSARK
jgi:hypothetical protein